MTPRRAVFAGLAATIALAALWHGPVGGAGARVAAETEALARVNLDYYDMGGIDAWVERDPLTRRLWLAGPANDFQQGELARILDGLPLVSDVQWWREGGGRVTAPIVLPLVVEAELAAIGSFAIGFLLSTLVAMRRRAIRGRVI